MKKIISSIILIVFLVTTNVYALDSNSTFDEIVKSKSEIPTDISIKKKNGKYGVLDKKTKEVLIPYEYKAIKKLGIDTVMLCDDKNTCIISTNNNIPLLKSTFKQKNIKEIVIDKKKQKDISNMAFYVLINNDNKMLVYPSYSSKKFFRDYIDLNNQISNFKFEDYPINDEIGILLKIGGSNYILQSIGENFYIYWIKDLSDVSLISKMLNVFYVEKKYRDKRVKYPKEKINIDGEKVVIRYEELIDVPNKYYGYRTYNVIAKENNIGINDEDGNELVSLRPYIKQSVTEKKENIVNYSITPNLVTDYLSQKDIDKNMKNIEIFVTDFKKTYYKDIKISNIKDNLGLILLLIFDSPFLILASPIFIIMMCNEDKINKKINSKIDNMLNTHSSN